METCSKPQTTNQINKYQKEVGGMFTISQSWLVYVYGIICSKKILFGQIMNGEQILNTD